MDEGFKKEILEVLNKELSKQKGIFNKHAPRVIHPNSKGYDEARKAFDAADRKIKSLEHEIAYITCEEVYEPTIIDRIVDIVDKIVKDDNDTPDQGADLGVRG